ncbi:hypothetical protein ACF0H5_006234 [Mactra antiquata]
MESSFYVIILLLIFLKLAIWLCVIYSRSRRREILRQNGIIILQGDGTPGPGVNNSMNGQSHGGIDNPGLSAPPSYEEVQRTISMEEKPPSYDQIAGYYAMPVGNMSVPQVNQMDLPNNNLPTSTNSSTVSPQLPEYSEANPNRGQSSST